MKFRGIFLKNLKMKFLGLIILAISATVSVTAAIADQTKELPLSRFDLEGLSEWSPKIFKGETQYSLVEDNGRKVVQAISHAGASGMVKEIDFNPAEYRYLRWSWKINDTIAGGDERIKAGDDYAARVYVVFPGRFFWQTRAINYIWANQLPQGQSIPNPFTSQAIMVAVQSGPSRTGEWVNEERNIYSDYKRLFGEEPKKAGAIAIMTDTDNTGESAMAWYKDIILSTSPK
ncbi:MAG: DUF3047 domain-containing protein [Desulforhopalus sp.]